VDLVGETTKSHTNHLGRFDEPPVTRAKGAKSLRSKWGDGRAKKLHATLVAKNC
jgi:hypothetical protein